MASIASPTQSDIIFLLSVMNRNGVKIAVKVESVTVTEFGLYGNKLNRGQIKNNLEQKIEEMSSIVTLFPNH